MEVTLKERIRFIWFWIRHPFAKMEYRYPPGVGYILYAISRNEKYKEDITDYDFMFDNF